MRAQRERPEARGGQRCARSVNRATKKLFTVTGEFVKQKMANTTLFRSVQDDQSTVEEMKGYLTDPAGLGAQPWRRRKTYK
jgi:hypothetical protein